MKFSTIIMILLSVMFWSNCYSQDNIYTWRDKNGVLNITDVPPPPDAELVEISPSYRTEAMEINRQRSILMEKIEQEQREKKEQQAAAREAQQNAAALEEASGLLDRAEEMREGVEGSARKKRRYERRAERLEEQAEKLIENPELIEKKEKPAKKRSGY